MSSKQRPSSGYSYNASSEDDSPAPLSPPRPFFLTNDRTSSTSSDPASDSDRDSPPPTTVIRTRSSNRRRRSQFAPVEHHAPPVDDTWSPTALYAESRSPPPSSFSFPFQAYPGNPDPVPGLTASRRSSVESIRMASRSPSTPTTRSPPAVPRSLSGSALARPQPPFMAAEHNRASSGSNLTGTLPRTSSATTFRTPFLSPASRPSSVWSPPSVNTPSHSSSALPLPPPPTKKPLPSTRLSQKLTNDDKPWVHAKHGLDRASWWLTFAGLVLGFIGAAVLCFTGYEDVDVLKDSQLCLVLDDEFDTLDLQNTWTRDVELGGFGNGEFEMTTDLSANSYIQNGQLYILPTLTSASISGGYSSVLDGGSYTLDGCTAGAGTPATNQDLRTRQQDAGGGDNGGTTTNTTTTGTGTNSTTTPSGSSNSTTTTGGTNSTTSSNSTSSSGGGTGGGGGNPCTAVSSAAAGTVINPVMSARLNTKGKKSIGYGRVEVRAKLPSGDWLWPAIWMLPEGNSSSSAASNGSGTGVAGAGVYGTWPVSGEIDIMEARGNGPTYPAQGSNYVRSSLNYGPFAAGTASVTTSAATLVKNIYGWVSTKRGNYADDFHVYAMEWTGEWMRFYTDSRLQAMINLKMTSSAPDSYFFKAGGFPATAMNVSSGEEVVVQDPWAGGSNAAPFDQQFYMVIDLAVGGTSGWFPDGLGGKMWYDGSPTAMQAFAKAQDTWSATWPQSADDLAFRIDYVKMWQLCG